MIIKKNRSTFKLLTITIAALDIGIYKYITNIHSIKWCPTYYTQYIKFNQYNADQYTIKYLIIKYLTTNKFNLKTLTRIILQEYINDRDNQIIHKYFTKFICLYKKVFTYYEYQHVCKCQLKELAIYYLYILHQIIQTNTS